MWNDLWSMFLFLDYNFIHNKSNYKPMAIQFCMYNELYVKQHINLRVSNINFGFAISVSSLSNEAIYHLQQQQAFYIIPTIVFIHFNTWRRCMMFSMPKNNLVCRHYCACRRKKFPFTFVVIIVMVFIWWLRLPFSYHSVIYSMKHYSMTISSI